MKFERNWREVAGKPYLYVRPMVNVSDKDWMDFLYEELTDYQGDELLMLINAVGVEENIGIELFSHASELLIKCGVQKTNLAVLPPNDFYPTLMSLLEQTAMLKGVDLEVQLFQQPEAAILWLGNQNT